MVVHFALARLGAVAVNINTSVTSSELKRQMESSVTQLLIVDHYATMAEVAIGEAASSNQAGGGSSCLKMVLRVQQVANHSYPNWETCTKFLHIEDLAHAGGSNESDAYVVERDPSSGASFPDSDRVFQMYFTSGTTGLPKLIALSQGAVCSHAIATAAEMRLHSGDVWLHA